MTTCLCITFIFIRSTIKERSEEFVTKLTMANVGRRPLIWVAHSMGGLLIKKMLVEGMYKLEIYANFYILR